MDLKNITKKTFVQILIGSVGCSCPLYNVGFSKWILSKLCILDERAKYTHTHMHSYFHVFSPHMHFPNNFSVSPLISDIGPALGSTQHGDLESRACCKL